MAKKAKKSAAKRKPNEPTELQLRVPLPVDVRRVRGFDRDALVEMLQRVVQQLLVMAFRRWL